MTEPNDIRQVTLWAALCVCPSSRAHLHGGTENLGRELQVTARAELLENSELILLLLCVSGLAFCFVVVLLSDCGFGAVEVFERAKKKAKTKTTCFPQLENESS